MKEIILASASPRRKEILEGIGLSFRILPADADETCDLTDPAEFVRELARRKGQAIYSALSEQERENAVILSADTVVVSDGKILGKPHDRDDAIGMLTRLSGHSHTVLTGIGVTVDGVTHTAAEATLVRVDDIPRESLLAYVDSGQPMDKAGSYGIQGAFSQWIRGIEGCYFNVVGLPVNALDRLYYTCTGEHLGAH